MLNWFKLNRLKLFVILVIVAMAMLLYVDNTIKINALLSEIQYQTKELHELNTNNELLKSKIIELESADRITNIADKNLGLAKPTKLPILINSSAQEIQN